MFEIEPIDKFLTVLKGEEWKSIRSIVTTTFTSGKLKTVRIKLLYFFFKFKLPFLFKRITFFKR